MDVVNDNKRTNNVAINMLLLLLCMATAPTVSAFTANLATLQHSMPHSYGLSVIIRKEQPQKCTSVMRMMNKDVAQEGHKKKYQAETTSSSSPSWHRVVSQVLVTILFCLGTIMSTSSSSWADDSSRDMRYWSIMRSGPPELVIAANEGLIDHAVGTINTMYYDNSGGAYFTPQDMYERWKSLRQLARKQAKITTGNSARVATTTNNKKQQPHILASREGTVQALKYLVSTLNDPFSRYLTRQELLDELNVANDGFLGLGAMVETPMDSLWSSAFSYKKSSRVSNNDVMPRLARRDLLSTTRVSNLPVVTAVAPDSPAERAGLVVGDRIVSVGSDKFLGLTRSEVSRALQTRYSAENYAGHPDVTVAKALLHPQEEDGRPDVVVGYRLSRVRLSTTLLEPFRPYAPRTATDDKEVSGGDAIVHYELLTPSDSILDRSSTSPVGYIRLTRFSRASTAGYLNAVSELEAAGAQSYIIDIRNNYGGVIQEAMLTASTLLRDPHAVLCYTMNSRGGFTPHDAEEYIVDKRYPGYLLSSEPSTVTIDQVKRESPEFYQKDGINWAPPSSYASLHEQTIKRGIRRMTTVAADSSSFGSMQWNAAFTTIAGRSAQLQQQQVRAQKKVVLLINEGTASSAEVFASALHDNGRTVALVGAKTYGKGLIQHTFPMPDGGGLRLTVAEYLTPSLQHVTNVGSARFDRNTGEWVGGGLRPDVVCESKQGIPSNVGADLCVGMALDAIEDAEVQVADSSALPGQLTLRRAGGSGEGGYGTRRPVSAGIVRDDF